LPGTAHYAAPEYRLQRTAGNTADYFSVGVMVYRMLSGKLPYGEAYAEARSSADFSRLQYTPLYSHNPLVPAWVDGAVRKLVSLSAEHRYRELSEFIADIKHPNPQFTDARDMPLLEKHPLAFWQGLSAVLGIGCLILFYLAFLA
jgi:serine/threonine protein kinase